MVTVAQVSQASDIRLMYLAHEIFLDNVQLAINNKVEMNKYTQKAKEVIHILVGNLNFDEPICGTIFQIYVYVQKMLIKYEDLEIAYDQMKKLQDVFAELEERRPNQQAVMQNVEKVYAGMTYGKHQVDEFVISDNRGFQA